MSQYVVFDLEMCHIPKGGKRRAFGHFMELIEIGAVVLSESLEVVDRFKTYVKPVFGVMDAYIQELTGITPANLENAPSTEQALTMFASWIPDGAVLVAWSDNDEYQLRMELQSKHIDNPKLEALLDGVIDCQPMFTQKMNSTKVYRLAEALPIAAIDYDESFHDALTDAYNTALLFAKMQREPVLKLSRFYETEESTKGTFSPFAALLADLAEAG